MSGRMCLGDCRVGPTSPWSWDGIHSTRSIGKAATGDHEATWIFSSAGRCSMRAENLNAYGGRFMDRFDRQRKIFGDEGQKRLGASAVGVVGAGGLGSFMALELAYLGVGKILIVDDDLLDDEHTNRNRLVGAWESHAPGVPKVHILRDLAMMIDSGIEIEVVEDRLESADATASLAVVDVVVGCLDHDGPRFALNKFCCQHGLPLIDSASDTIPEEGEVIFGGRVCVATPDTGCLVCFGVLDQDDIREYFESPSQRTDRRSVYGVNEDALGGGGPAVITVNGVVASIAATESMVLVTGIRAPIAHQEWRGDQGYLTRPANREEGCYYCGLRPR